MAAPPSRKPGGASVNDELQALEFFLPVRLVNTLNARHHWVISARRARQQREAVAAAVLAKLRTDKVRLRVAAAVPKRIVFHAHVGRAFDTDGLQAALKHIRDGLQDAGLIDTDGPTSGHRFVYTQLTGTPPAARGVTVRVTCR